MDGHDLDGGTIAFEALNVAVFAGRLACFLDVSGQSRDQVGQIAADRARLFEQDLEDVQVIRQRSLIILEKQLAANDSGLIENPGEQRLESTLAGQFVPIA